MKWTVFHKCHEQAYLNNQPYNRLRHAQYNQWVAQRTVAGRKEATTMEGRYAENECLQRGKMPKECIKRGKRKDYTSVPKKTSCWLVSITNKRIQE